MRVVVELAADNGRPALVVPFANVSTLPEVGDLVRLATDDGPYVGIVLRRLLDLQQYQQSWYLTVEPLPEGSHPDLDLVTLAGSR